VHRHIRKAVLIAGFASLAAGLVLMVGMPWRLWLYASLFAAALVLSIASIAQKQVWSGLALLLLTITVPPTILLTGLGDPGQVVDTEFRPPIEKPAYPIGRGPVVLIDEAHSNFQTATGRYLPFADLLRRDGYVVKASPAQFSAKVLESGRVLVIANATAALTAEEVAAVRDWVPGGGSLLLIADHPPFDAGAKDLGKTFGVRFSDGVAGSGRLVFRRSDGTLADHLITKGIDEVATFVGTSFQVEDGGQPLLVFGPAVYLWQENSPTPRSLKGHLQGAVLLSGKGRVAVFGEAAMFSAQLTGLDRHAMGMNAPIAKQNSQFLLNLMHWLTRVGEQLTDRGRDAGCPGA
jgi:Domain of unknown function (DUF4350)